MADPAPEQTDLLAALRAEFNEQLNELKAANAETIKKSEERIATLESENKALKAQFILSATATPSPEPEPEPEPTPEEKYKAEVDRLAKLSKDYMKLMS